jgi:hypothetical protein
LSTLFDSLHAETAINSDNDTDIESDTSISVDSMLTVEEETLGEIGEVELSRTFRSAYAIVHGKEPLATNWNGDFKE